MDYLKNGWNWVHFFGSCVLSLTFCKWLFHNELAFILAFGCGLIWELIDEAKHQGWVDWCLFDPDGFSFADVMMNLFGILYALLLKPCC